jgi:hypothetical protein
MRAFNRTSVTGLDCPDASPHAQAVAGGSGLLTRLPSATPFGLALGTDLPCADELNAGNLRFSARLIPTVVIATYADKVFSARSTLSRPWPEGLARPFGASSLPAECSPTIEMTDHRSGRSTQSQASVACLSPVELSVQGCLTSELLRFL